MRNHLLISCFLTLALTACEQSEYCADVEPNATVTDVLHDTAGGGRLTIGLYHALSYCTGTDEQRFSNERIEVDLATGAVTVDQRASNQRGPLALPDAGVPLFRDGQFSSRHCGGCELLLRSLDQRYVFHFTTFESFEPVMALEILDEDEGATLAVVDIGGYSSESRASR